MTDRQELANMNDCSFERPILIESDSDEIEEELVEKNPYQYTILTCYKCNKIIPYDPTVHNSLSVSYDSTMNICTQCASKKRTRSRSFTFEGNNVFNFVADKLKHSFSNNNLLSPNSNPNMHRRKSMPSMNVNFASLEPPSPTPSRPSSRASSFFEDFKQLLSPLSRKSSRNSMYQEYQIDDSDALKAPSEGHKRKTSCSSLLEAFHLCKPKQRSPSYERQIMNDTTKPSQQEDESSWDQDDDKFLDIHQRTHQDNHLEDDQYVPMENHVHVPLRRKQVQQIGSRQKRIDLYNNAYFDCMQIETNLIPWIIKQTQKGPPDAWFGYTPPPRQPKKFLGIFKRKTTKSTSMSENTRAQQLQLGDDLLRKSTPYLHHRYSSNLSISPANSTTSFLHSPTDTSYEQQQKLLVGSPSAINSQDIEDCDDYFNSHQQPKDEYSNSDHHLLQTELQYSSHGVSPRESYSSSNCPLTPTKSNSQPVSILKKSSISQEPKYFNHPSYFEEPIPYDDEYYSNEDEERYDNMHHIGVEEEEEADYHPRRPMNMTVVDDSYYQSPHIPIMMRKKENKEKYSNQRKSGYRRSINESLPPEPMMHYTSKRRSVTPVSSRRSYCYDDDDYFDYYNNDGFSISPQKSNSFDKRRTLRNNHYSYYDQNDTRRQYDDNDEYIEDMDHKSYHYTENIRKSNWRTPLPPPIKTQHYGYKATARRSQHYDVQIKSPLEEWEIVLDELCILFPRMDRDYINEFLTSAKGDFITAKSMIIQMIMGD
ncbi:uncharacterized protein BX663DRAFT_25950 [Cokeromyces recurvatus]|uniref:uncharacterized protein n=1 Tax=Cokeromyces recurvatus TaxID=90255 RepID=UPI00221F523E|nr:uncharacterized protein BX663DRAFT_25950 [Cokeromyces recurvatus]KAI7908252.1 hypothetical protein BX663DRAFT_25950 [Cokeromyces recurvatus]